MIMFFSIYDFYLILPEIFLFLSILIVLLFSVILAMSENRGFPILNLSLGWVSFFVILFTYLILWNSSNLIVYLFNGLLFNDSIAYFSKNIILVISVFWVFLSLLYINEERLNFFEIWILLLLALLTMLFLVSSFDLLSLYLSIELQSLIFYILASSKRTSEFSAEAGLKYFILGSFSSIILLLGFSFIYGLTGLTNFSDLSKLLISLNLFASYSVSNSILFSILLIIISLLFKIGVVPFHFWLPDVYEGAPSNITAFFALFPKFVVLIVFSRLFISTFQSYFIFWQQILIFCVNLSLIVGSFGAFVQTKWKRFLAYSSIFHVGFILLAIINGTLKSIEGFLFYIVTYMVMTLSIFVIFFCLRIWEINSGQLRYISDIKMLFKANPLLALSLAIVLFSIAGVPPLIGFFSKLFVFLSLLEGGFFGLLFMSILLSSLACFYYLRLIKIMYFEFFKDWPFFVVLEKKIAMTLSLSLFIVIFFFANSEWVLLFIRDFALSFVL
uniref:NADH dehydrogenase subunit 2 n=1 Tax=Glaucosphaera vacuolata TaxID=38265 RepID=UPI001FCD354E|nr:NADH dehydrogenase subunit 2 [Glaucosphaera vacuolata]UNJ18768.1 NADH dehydrogenase subunit 2 [Glaucosphaera vacuolata]